MAKTLPYFRPAGFYWIVLTDEWIVAQWDYVDENWWIPGEEKPYKESQLKAFGLMPIIITDTIPNEFVKQFKLVR